MPSFTSDGVRIAYEVYGNGDPVLLIHGFGSNGRVNWVETGWVETLVAEGYGPVVIDNRGHGASEKLYDPAGYTPQVMAADAVGLLDELRLERVPVLGFSMGARIAAFMALHNPGRVLCSVWGGMAMNLVSGLSDSAEIIAALLAPSLADVSGRTARQFRAFAERTGADRRALAACMETSRMPMSEQDVRRIERPVLVVVGSEDVMAGPPEPLAAMLPDGRAVVVAGRDHMRTSGDPQFRNASVAFLERYRGQRIPS